MSIKSEVENIIKKRWEGLSNPKELISLYNIEKQTNQGYNGRQLLELFQNCEDEGASQVKILLDTQNCLLEISNDGDKPFSIKGYDSVFYPGLSSKISSGYIGNKGLGFRSIINWAEEISIISNNFKVVFSTEFKKDILLNKIGYTEEELTEIRRERKLNADIYPIPFLNCCEILDLETQQDYTTTISIKYKKNYEEDIKNQLKSISLKTLLFLKHINTIVIEGDVLNNTISVSRNRIDENNAEIESGNEIYYVLSDEGIVDEDLIDDKESSEPKRYSVKIAYNNDLTFRDEVLYNYFKTQIPFGLPFVVHASLELDQNRNHSTESKVNPFILNKLFQLHLKFIEILKMKWSKSWLPYQAINNDFYTVYKPYSEIIDDNWDKLEIYPTLSGNYYTHVEAKNLGNKFAKFLEENNIERYFEPQIVFCDLEINAEQYVKKPENYSVIIESIATNLNFKQRAKFVRLLLEIYPYQKFAVLIDEKNNLIKKSDYVFTDKTSENKDLKVPGYSKIRFLHPDLYKALISELGLESEPSKSRALKDKLERISDVHSFEPQTVIKKIISETTEILDDGKNESTECINEFYRVLFHNYKARESSPVLEYDAKIPCLNQLGKVEDIKKLVLSEEFEIGKISKKIFDGLYEGKWVITNIENLGLVNEDITEVERFLKWLGINHFSIIERKSSNLDNYYTFTLKTAHKVSNFSSYELFDIKNFDKVILKGKSNINHIIAWLSLDEKVNSIFNNFTSTNSSKEKLNYSFHGPKTISSFKNLIYYTISKEFEIQNYLITNKKEEWFNPFRIDYEYLKEVNSKLEKNEVDRILVFFNAKTDFNKLGINYLRTKTEQLANKKNHNGAQVFYKSLVGHYKENHQKILNVDLYAKEGDHVIVKKSNDIYYSDRIQLPDSLSSKFPILYYPSRSGGAAAIEMFGLKNLNELDLKIISSKENRIIQSDFDAYLKEIKPFILAYRLDKITKEEVKKTQVQRLNKLKINCCETLVCSIDDESFEVEPYNYVFSSDQFYIKITGNTLISALKQNKQFIDNLSDIYLKVFDTLDEKKMFESILKQSKDDNIYDINNELAEGILEEAKILLGEISIRLSIWKTIFKIKYINELAELNDNNIEEKIRNNFPEIAHLKLFDSDDNLDEIKRIRDVFSALSINIEDYNSVAEYKLSFDKLFNKELKDFYDERKKGFKNKLWNYIKDKDIKEQSDFLRFLYQIEHLLQENVLNESCSSYDFNSIILAKLQGAFPSIITSIDSDGFEDYDKTEQDNIKHFTDDELLIIRKDQVLNSLSYFENRIDFIRSEIKKKEEKIIENQDNGFHLDLSQTPELIENFEMELDSTSINGTINSGPWLGGDNELSSGKKKTLGINVEEVVKKYLDNNPTLYEYVEHISKTNEGEHYDIKYYDVKDKKIKFVECKYYNGISFFLTRDEKIFADKHVDQYEIWLVNKESQIFCIKDVQQLGELQPANYCVNVKLKRYAITN